MGWWDKHEPWAFPVLWAAAFFVMAAIVLAVFG